MPIFCKKHDNDLFCEFEGDADSAEPYNPRFQILQALRAIGALRYRELKRIEQNTIKASIDSLYSGWVYHYIPTLEWAMVIEDSFMKQSIINGLL